MSDVHLNGVELDFENGCQWLAGSWHFRMILRLDSYKLKGKPSFKLDSLQSLLVLGRDRNSLPPSGLFCDRSSPTFLLLLPIVVEYKVLLTFYYFEIATNR